MVLIFITAVIGRIASVLYEAKKLFLSGKTQLPKRYRQPAYYIICLSEAMLAGVLALCLSKDSTLGAFAIGATLPTMLKTPTTVAKLLKIGR
jgi:hypothetical protein